MIEVKEAVIPELRFPEFEDEWIKKKLGKLGDFCGGGTPSSLIDEYWIGPIPWISSSDIKEDTVQEVEISRFISAKAIKNSATKLIPKNSILIVSRVGIGKFAVAKQDLCTSQDFTNLIPYKDNSLFLAYYFKAKSNRFKSLSQGTSIKGFTGRDIRGLKFIIPLNNTEQQKIATFLTAVDKRIQLLQQKKEKLERYKKGMMQKLFSQEIRFKDENGGDNRDWEEKKLGEVLFEHKERNSTNIVTEVFSVSKGKGVVNQIEHLGRSYAAESIKHYKVANPGDIIYTKSPTSDFPFGIIKQNLTERIGVTSPLYGVFSPRNSALGYIIHSYFLSWVNTYNYLIPLVHRGAKNTMNINNYEFLNGAKILLPKSEQEQQKIAAFLSSLDKKINQVSQQIQHTQTWKKGLLQKMFV
ncbi:MAG: restriction endonuclease subunit S [Balneolales bacterium]